MYSDYDPKTGYLKTRHPSAVRREGICPGSLSPSPGYPKCRVCDLNPGSHFSSKTGTKGLKSTLKKSVSNNDRQWYDISSDSPDTKTVIRGYRSADTRYSSPLIRSWQKIELPNVETHSPIHLPAPTVDNTEASTTTSSEFTTHQDVGNSLLRSNTGQDQQLPEETFSSSATEISNAIDRGVDALCTLGYAFLAVATSAMYFPHQSPYWITSTVGLAAVSFVWWFAIRTMHVMDKIDQAKLSLLKLKSKQN